MIARFFTRLIDAQAVWSRPLGDFNVRVLRAVLRPLGPVKDFLHGKWLGHSLHATLTDLPIGALTLVLIFDILGQRAAADVGIAFVLLTMIAAAVAGLTDYSETDGLPRQRATVHQVLMTTATILVGISLALRAGGADDRTLPVVLAFVAYAVIAAGAYVGGEVVYASGNMVSRHAWRRAGQKWWPLDVTEIPEATPTKANAGPHALVVVRYGQTLHALHDTCAHAGGPLSGGSIVDGCIECPWHGSRFELATGHKKRGPTTFDQPRYEVRPAAAGGYEARAAAP